MNCSNFALNGLAVGCSDNMGGIKEVYIAVADDISGVTLDSESNMISGITMLAGKTFKTYSFRKQTGSLTSTITKDDAIGTQYFTNELALQFSKMETAKRIEMTALTIGDTKAIVLDQNGKYWFLGYDNPVSATAAVGQSGTAYGDLNGYTLTLSDMSKEMPYEVAASAVAAVIE